MSRATCRTWLKLQGAWGNDRLVGLNCAWGGSTVVVADVITCVQKALLLILICSYFHISFRSPILAAIWKRRGSMIEIEKIRQSLNIPEAMVGIDITSAKARCLP